MDDDKIKQFTMKAKAAGYSDDEIAREVFRKRMEVEGPTEDPVFKPEKSVTGFIYNTDRDARKIAGGVAQLPSVAKHLYENPDQIDEAAGEVVKGTVKSYWDLVTNPTDTVYNRPVESFLNLLPVLKKADAMTKAGKFGETAKNINNLGRTSMVDDAARMASLADDADPATQRVLSGVDDVDEPYKTGRVARKVYQSKFPFSKKGNSYERLKPAETIDDMVYYGIDGTQDDIAKATHQVTGSNGIVTKVVNEAVSEADFDLDITPAQNYLDDISSSQYSTLDADKIDDLKIRLSTIKPDGKINTVRTSKLLDFERAMQKEGFADLLKGQRTSNAAAEELGRIKLGLADEIGTMIDDSVNQAGTIDKFKNPAIYEKLKGISPRLADDYMAAESISDLRTLQKPFVRMSQIIDLYDQEGSSLGGNFFRALRNIPGVGAAIDVGVDEIATPAVTKGAVALDRLPDSNLAGNLTSFAGGVKNTANAAKNAAPLAAPLAAQTPNISFENDQPAIDPQTPPPTPQPEADPMVTIRNKQTGETKQVPQSQLSEYTSPSGGMPMPSKEDFQMMAMQDMVETGGKNFSKIKAYQEYFYPEEDEKSAKSKTSTQVKLEAMARSGMNAAKKAQTMLQKDPSILLKQKAPGSLFTREFDNAMFNAVDAILRMRTGAQAPEKEIRRYMTLMGPVLGDSQEVAQLKLQGIIDELEYIYTESSNTYLPEDQAFQDPTAPAFQGM